jgi:uncharacterized protein (TIRG00374 family)
LVWQSISFFGRKRPDRQTIYGSGMTSERELARSPGSAGLQVRSSDQPGWPRLFVLKIVVSTTLLAWIISRTSFAEIFSAVWSASIPILLAAYAMNCIATMASISRWRLLLQVTGATLPRLTLLRSYLVAMFFNSFLPSTVGGDTSRALDAYRMTGGNRGAMSSVVLDRLLGLLALSILALLSLHFAGPLSEYLPILQVWLSLAVAGLAGVIGAVFCGLSRRRLAWATTQMPQALHRAIASIAGAVEPYRGQWRTLILAFALSFVLQLSVIVCFILVARALGLRVPALDFCLIVPLISFIIMLPISINGVGLRENAFALMLGYYGVAPGEAIALAWLIYFGSSMFALAGGVIYVSRFS